MTPLILLLFAYFIRNVFAIVVSSTRSECDIQFSREQQDSTQCIKFIRNKVSWFNAEDYCQHRFRGHLLTIESYEEEELVKEFLSSIEEEDKIFLGLYIGDDGEYHWSDEKTHGQYSDWISDDNDSKKKKCVALDCKNYNKCKWKKVGCGSSTNKDDLHKFFCQSEKIHKVVVTSTATDRSDTVNLHFEVTGRKDEFDVEIEGCGAMSWEKSEDGNVISSIVSIDTLYTCSFDKEETEKYITYSKMFYVWIDEDYKENILVKFRAKRDVNGYVSGFFYDESSEFDIQYIIDVHRTDENWNVMEEEGVSSVKVGEVNYYLVFSPVPLDNQNLYLTKTNVFIFSDSAFVNIDKFYLSSQSYEDYAYVYKIQFTLESETGIGDYNYLYFNFQASSRRIKSKITAEEAFSFKRIIIFGRDVKMDFVIFLSVLVSVLASASTMAICTGCGSIFICCFKKKWKKIGLTIKTDKNQINENTPLRNELVRKLNLSPSSRQRKNWGSKTVYNPRKTSFGNFVTPIKKNFEKINPLSAGLSRKLFTSKGYKIQ